MAETLAMALIETNELGSFHANKKYMNREDLSVDALAASGAFTCKDHRGSYFGSLNLNVMKNGAEDKICSGRAVLESSTQLLLNFGQGGRNPVNLFVFPKYHQHISLDMSPSGDALFHVIQ